MEKCVEMVAVADREETAEGRSKTASGLAESARRTWPGCRGIERQR
jgi:hypothetical protein